MNNKNDQNHNHRKIEDTDLKKIKNLGHLLKKRRLSLNISFKEAEKQTKIRAHYLKLIESSDYDKLSDEVYTRGFVKNYAEYLGFDSRPIIDMFKSETRIHKTHSSDELRGKSPIGLTPLHSARLVFTPKTLIALSSIAIIGAIFLYIVWQVVILASPPKLTISNQPVQEVNANFVFISGKAEGGADLFINDSPVLAAPDGSFREKISLIEGSNLIKVTAKNKLGKSVSVDRVVIAKIPANISNKSTDSNSSEKIDGVKILVKISKQATWLIVVADGKEIFRGTMLVGSMQTFEAADNLKITTGNAGATQLIVSDKLMLNKDLGTVGADGEIKRDLEFKKDTLIK